MNCLTIVATTLCMCAGCAASIESSDDDVVVNDVVLMQSHLHVGGRESMSADFRGRRFDPTKGTGGALRASHGDDLCDEDSYYPSFLETDFSANVELWTTDLDSMCEHLTDREEWLQEIKRGSLRSGDRFFSSLCKKGRRTQILEPLAGILRSPNFLCDGSEQEKMSVDWLVLADKDSLEKSDSKSIFFDAGGTRFIDAMSFFTSQYEKQGISLDKIYVWEAIRQGRESYWWGVPREVRAKWEPRLTFYDGVSCRADPDHKHNPARRILEECRPEDFCSFKLDIDDPSIELPIVEQLLSNPRFGSLLDEFFFEHHVHGLMQDYGWEDNVNGTLADSYRIFTQLRKMGVRAHSWV